MSKEQGTEAAGAHVALMIGARLLAGAVSAAIGLLVPRLLSRTEYADYGIAIGIAATLVVLSDLGLTSSLARALASGRADMALLRRAALLRAGTAALFGGVLASVGFVAFADRRLGTYLALAGLLVVTSSALGVALGLLPTLRKVRGLLLLTVLQPVLELTGTVVALTAGFGGSGVIVAAAAAGTLTGSIGLLLVARGAHSRTVGENALSLGAVARYGRALFLVALAFTIFGQIDQLLVYLLRGADEAAGYIAMWRLVTLLHLGGLAAATIVAPRLTGGGPAARALFDGWLRTLVTAYLFLAAITAATASFVVPAALGEQYRQNGNLLAALSVYALLLGIAPLVTMAANFLGSAGRRIAIAFGALAVNVVIDLALVPPLGGYGAAIGTTAAFGLYVGLHLRLAHELLGQPARVDVDGARIAPAFDATWLVRSLAAAAVGAGVGRAGMQWLTGPAGAIPAVLLAGFAAVAAAVFVAWGNPRNAAPRIPLLPAAEPAGAPPVEGVA